ncbi:unnamed protein product [Meganyctiphanes norvegica]|uniref:phosphoethanolamine N-methyltransferase n=1 Tax=Meganyctiphanes norvegica TaxID=48144 RepID=A0AAV2Q9X0_MEGNR
MADNPSQVSLDDFYTTEYILQKERLYGLHYSSSGGEAATKDLLLRARLQPNEKVLDVCCGQGGPAMFMARHFGVHVHGIDISQNLINLGRQRLAVCEPIVQQRVQLEIADATTVQLQKNYYDVIYSKDSITMIENKKKLFENLMSAVRPSGRIFISDWCRGEINLSQPTYNRGYKLKGWDNMSTVQVNVQYIEAAGFKSVTVEDNTKDMINYLENALRFFEATKQAFIKDFDCNSYKSIEEFFSVRVENMKEGTIRWVLFTAAA